ncbi:relaxase/mobilization nuclease domain-containing protein, partial [Klebsiella quasipneumoniae]
MIVKIHSRGAGSGSGPVDYLLGKDRQREQASVLRGNPEHVRELIDGCDFARAYTSGVLSFQEPDIADAEKSRLMDEWEHTLLTGFDRDQYACLWVEHRDKGRLELNFVIPNIELQSGKRLQPYFDRADRPRVNAWQTLTNDRLEKQAQALESQGNWAQAAEVQRRRLALDPDSVWITYRLARDLVSAGERQQADALMRAMVNRRPQDAERIYASG